MQYQWELSKTLPKLLKTVEKYQNSLVHEIIPKVLESLFNSNNDVLHSLPDNFQELLKYIPEPQKQSWLVTSLLKLLHDDSPDKVEIGITLLSLTIPSLPSEVCQNFLFPEIQSMSQGELKFRLFTLELLPNLLEKIEDNESQTKLVDLFIEFCQNPDPQIKLICLKKFEKMFAICEDSVSIQKLQPTFKEFLKDKNDKVRHKAHLQLGPLLYASKAPIPHSLLELYLKLAKTIPSDKELQAHCAYYFPAVVEKMGKDSWEVLGDTFLYLARSGEPSTKKSCASSLHHIINIIGPSSEELIKLFLEFLSDKQFRYTIMGNIHEILKNVPIDSRALVIEPLKIMTKDKNFRVRALVATKIALIGNLFTPLECFAHIWPICKTLCLDPIGLIRTSAMQGIGISAVYIATEIPNYSNEIIKDLKKFGRSAKSIHRLVFASACFQLVDLVEFEAAFGDDFLVLCKDKVPAVRICCAKAVKKVKSLRKYWVELKELLKTDEDFDVRREINGDCFYGHMVLAGESQAIIKAPAVRNCVKVDDFEDIWEIHSNESQFSFMVNDFRPSQEGWVILNS